MSYVEDFANRANEKLLDHEVFKLAVDYFKRMQADDFDELGRVLYQSDPRFGPTISDAYWFMNAYTLIAQTGQIAVATIQVGEGPGPDSEMSDNQSRLQRALARVNALHSDRGDEPLTCTFTVELQGGPGDNDGFIEWKGTIPFQVYREGKFSHCHPIDAGFLPMEVGTTRIATTVQHFMLDRGVARWPYESEWLTLLKVIDNNLLTPNYAIFEADGRVAGKVPL